MRLGHKKARVMCEEKRREAAAVARRCEINFFSSPFFVQFPSM
jgi:hypothetical protein